MARVLTPDLTSYDFYKTAAVILMIVDHVGYYFYPDDDWLRVVGRLCVPVWFFLIGYARSRDVGWKLWTGAGLLLIGNWMAGMYFFPLNILATMLAIRLVIDPLMDRALQSTGALMAWTVLLTLLILPTSAIAEYGTQGLLIAMLGYLLRRKNEIALPHPQTVEIFLIFNVMAFIVFQDVIFGFQGHQALFLSIGSVISFTAVLVFRPMEFSKLTAALPMPVNAFFRLMGRRTLEIYVAHLLLFKALAVVLQPDRLTPFHWSLFSFS